MKIAILSFRYFDQPFSQEEERLGMAAKSLGHEAMIYRVNDCYLLCGEGKNQLFYKGEPFPPTDVVIPRAAVSNNAELQTAIIKQFELMGWPVVNGYLATNRAKNKLRTAQLLSQAGILVPKTTTVRPEDYLEASHPKEVIARTQEILMAAVTQVGGFPVILKMPHGSYGSGVVLSENEQQLKSIWGFMSTVLKDTIILVQEYIKEAKGQDKRVFVIGDQAIAGMERTAASGDFRSNLELGGSSKEFKLTPEISEIAVKATKVLGLDLAGVDIIITKNGPAVIEVNANAGFKGLEAATGKDVAGEIIKYAEKKLLAISD